MTTHEADVTVDTSGLLCPIPVVRARKALDAMQTGQILKLITTDPASVSDVKAFARRSGDDLLEQRREGSTFVFPLRKG